MTIKTKFNEGDRVWLIHKNTPTQKTIRSIVVATGGRLVGVPSPLIRYDFREHDCKGEFPEKELYPTKDKLLKSL